MGMYSYFETQEGIKINLEILKSEMEKSDIKDYLDTEQWERLKQGDEIGLIMDGWKIQGYWYADFCKFLFCIANSIPKENLGNSLTRQPYNYISFRYEEGYPFDIFFFWDETENKPAVEVEYTPLEKQTITTEELTKYAEGY
jgi:hypothetical protein